MTYAEEFESALKCTTKAEADIWLAQNIAWRGEAFGQSPVEAERVVKANLGYMAGYYNAETAKKIDALFGAGHPIFGGSDYFATVSPKQAFELGKKMAQSK